MKVRIFIYLSFLSYLSFLHLSRLLKGNLGVEPPDHDLGSLKTLEGHDLQEGDGVVIIPLVHLSYNGQ